MSRHRTRILMLAACAEGLSPLSLDREAREIAARLKGTPLAADFELVTAWAVRPADLLEQLNLHRPHIVHFSGHGKREGLYLEADSGGPLLVDSATLEEVFRVMRDNVRLVVLNACLSAGQAVAITRHVEVAIGMGREVGDEAAVRFAAQFYGALAHGRDVANAFDQGKLGVRLEGLPDHAVPQLFCRADADASQVRFQVVQEQDSAEDRMESESAWNWLYTAVGSPLCLAAIVCLSRRSRPRDPIELPFLGTPKYGEVLLVGCPLLILGAIFMLLICRRYAGTRGKVGSAWELLPPGFGQKLRGPLAPVRGLLAAGFILLPLLVAVGLFVEILRQGTVNMIHHPTEAWTGWKAFRWPADFFRGEDWRWNSRLDDDRPSFYPGLYPTLCVLGFGVAGVLGIRFACQLRAAVRPAQPHSWDPGASAGWAAFQAAGAVRGASDHLPSGTGNPRAPDSRPEAGGEGTAPGGPSRGRP